MKRHPISASLAALFLGASLAPLLAAPWPAWRSDLAGSGHSTETELPTEWSRDKNVKWRADLPEAGNSTPAVWGDRVFVTQPFSDEKFRALLCFDRETGKQLWKAGIPYSKPERTHRSNYYCSASPATDGEIVVAAFGSAGIAAYDFDGKELWRRDLGAIDHTWGNSSSPVIHGERVYHYHGPGKGAVLLALDRKTGETVWQFDEPDWKPGERTDGFRDRSPEQGVIGAFSTPILLEVDGREELVMSFPMELKAFDPATGKELWTCSGLNPLVYTSPVAAGDIIVAMGGYHGNSIGVRAGGNGDVTESHRLWQEVRHHGGIGSGVAKDGHIFFQDSGGIAYCIEAATGKEKWKERLPGAGKSWGSFVLAGDLIYTLSQAGDTVVFKADPEAFVVVAENDLGEQTNASLAPSYGEIFVRTHEGLWCISE